MIVEKEKTKIYPISAVYSRVSSTDVSLLKGIHEHFTIDLGVSPFIIRNTPKWDGKLRLFNGIDRTIYNGLLPELIEYIEKYPYKVNYSCNKDLIFKHEYNFSSQDINTIIERLNIHAGGVHIRAREHQLVALYHVMRTKRAVVVSPTGSGKSYIIYVLMRLLHSMGKKTLLLVPNISLIQQMWSDFKEYSAKDAEWDMKKEISVVTGANKKADNLITLANWQAIYTQNDNYFKQFTAVIVDEVHTAQSESLKNIMENCTNAYYRYGFTGTLQETKTHRMVIEGLFGPAAKFTTSKNLMEKGLLSNLSIKMVFLQYAQITRQIVNAMNYQEEMKFASTNKYKRRFVVKLAEKLKGNVLILVHLIEEHAVPLYNELKENVKEKKILYISGTTKPEEREKIRHIMERENNCILVASYGTTATGVNIKNIHHIIFASAFKSKIRVLQSIGRELRTLKGKEKAMLWDLVDDFSIKNKRTKVIKYNYLMNHAHKRLQMYQGEQFDYDVMEKVIEKGAETDENKKLLH